VKIVSAISFSLYSSPVAKKEKDLTQFLARILEKVEILGSSISFAKKWSTLRFYPYITPIPFNNYILNDPEKGKDASSCGWRFPSQPLCQEKFWWGNRTNCEVRLCPQILVALCNLAITLIHCPGSSQIAASRKPANKNPTHRAIMILKRIFRRRDFTIVNALLRKDSR
jgi:hypothetical protein